ncbi:MAG: outer membrane beta-barrel protein [Beijerinckiaceae bacterium]
MRLSRMCRGLAAVALLASAGLVLAADLDSTLQAPVAPIPDNVFSRLYHAYADEWGKPTPVADPNAPPSRRGTDQIAPQPEDSPPYPFTEWPYGGSTTIAAALPNSVDAPLQSALLPTTSAPGKWLEDQHIQIYGWVAAGGNLSTAHQYGGNNPAAYAYSPNLLELDQAVVYVERVPDTVQQSHWDWGFRVSGIYGENYRYTTALGVFSNQFVMHNHFEGYDMPMVYGELYLPQFAEALVLRMGRYISLPDIEAQLAPNNYMYSHSITYVYDNYTNTGLMATLKITKNWMVQAGISAGTETVPWNAKIVSLPNGYVGQRDPGTQPTYTVCGQWQSDSGWDNVYLCANDFNKGNWGYNNLQWFGGTWFHKFNDQWHFGIESYYEYQKGVSSVAAGYGGTAFQYMVNPPPLANCPAGETECTAMAYSALGYLNYKVGPMDNITGRLEFYNDERGQRTGYATRYFNQAIGYQHWLSPSVELRPEMAWYHSLDAAAFENGNKHEVAIASMDVTWHF